MKKIFLLVIILQLFVLPLYAQDQNAARKFGRGASNLVLGVSEIPRQMAIVREESGVAAGIFYGVPKGLFYTFGRMAVGLYELTTFIIPPYKPVVEPEFVLSEEYNDYTPDEE